MIILTFTTHNKGDDKEEEDRDNDIFINHFLYILLARNTVSERMSKVRPEGLVYYQ